MNKLCKPIGVSCIIGLIKTSIWRLFATSITFIIMFIYGLAYDKSLILALTDTVVKFITFFIFDRSWDYVYSKINLKHISNKAENDNVEPNESGVEEVVDNLNEE